MRNDLDGPGDDRLCVPRRLLLAGAGAGAVGLTGLLAACGGDDDPAPAGSPDSAESGGSLTTTSAVPVGGGTVVDGVVVTQPTEGTFKAYDATCPHMNAQVKAPEGGVITCPVHNSKFAVADGARISGPAPRGLSEVAITVAGTEITRA